MQYGTLGVVFASILIANRGEIAVRIIRTCRDLGIKAVAVYSEADREAMHVRLADAAYALGGQTSAESYLNVDAVCGAVAASGAQAVHPGYGFLSENADFASAVADAGAVFIGPPPAAIAIMGDKLSARRAAERVGVRSVPGMTEFEQTPPAAQPPAAQPPPGAAQPPTPDDVKTFAALHGYPVAVKAAYGGGGRGLKVVNTPEDIPEALESARREALAYFGRPELYLERYLTSPRHVEVQILADAHGGIISLGTRDCSSQRRHQKLIEEAPAPSIPPEIAAAMGEAAVAVARGCGYVNAGTVEMLYENGEFFYLEMNTRLQVEHPVTEMVTGLDLVAEQIHIAAGEPLRLRQSDVRLNGHAIEVRINAENPAGGRFLPSPGTISRLSPPAGLGTRFDAGYESGDVVSPLYDNLLGKLVCWAPDRQAAISRTLRALRETVVEGLHTTIPAHVAILSHPDFQAVGHSTRWVSEELDLSPLDSGAQTAMPGAEGKTATPDAEADRTGARAEAVRREIQVEVNSKLFKVAFWDTDEPPAGTAVASASPRRSAKQASGLSAHAGGEVRSPMQGTVIKVMVSQGEAVARGQALLMIEAMKMENSLTAPLDGTVESLFVEVGELVGSGDLLAVVA